MPKAALSQIAPAYAELTKTDFIDHFLVEKKILQTVDCPHIAKVIDSGEDENGMPYFVMPYYPIPSQKAIWITGAGPKPTPRRFAPENFYQFMYDLLTGLAEMHVQGISHRNLKFNNLFLNNEGRVVVLDFGKARWGKLQGYPLKTLSPFTCPEIRQNPQNADAKADVYSVGVMGFRLLMGRLPGPKGRSPHEIDLTIHQGYSEFIMKAIDSFPNNRPKDAKEMLSLLMEAKG